MTQNLYNLTFEKSILSAILFNPELFYKHKLTLEHFYLPAHKDIYNAMTSLVNDELPIDEEFLKQKLNKVGRFDESAMLDILSIFYLQTLLQILNHMLSNSQNIEIKEIF
jgi:replicative DNA helicase